MSSKLLIELLKLLRSLIFSSNLSSTSISDSNGTNGYSLVADNLISTNSKSYTTERLFLTLLKSYLCQYTIFPKKNFFLGNSNNIVGSKGADENNSSVDIYSSTKVYLNLYVYKFAKYSLSTVW